MMPRRTYDGRKGRTRQQAPAWSRWEWLINELERLNGNQAGRPTPPRDTEPPITPLERNNQ